MSEIFNFIDKKLISIKLPKGGQVMYRDKKEQGLVLRVSYAGSKSFYLYKYYDGKPRLINIGKFPRMSISEARTSVRDLKSKIEKYGYQGTSNSNKPVKTFTFEEILNQYIDQHIRINSNNPDKSIKTIMVEMKNAKTLYTKNVSTITTEDILEIFRAISTKAPIQANRVVVKLKAIFNWAIKCKYIPVNPTDGIVRNKETSRDRYITTQERDRFFKALYELENELMRDIFLMSLLTGARKGNIVSMRWDKICFETKTWSIPANSKIHKQGSKNGKSNHVYLNDETLKILANRKEKSTSECVFPSESSKSGHIEEPRKAWKKLCKNAGLEDLRIHDLRHTHASWLAINGVSLPIIAKRLGHKSLQSTNRYAHLSDDSVREAVDNTFNKIITNTKGKENNE
jgi:integrase